MEENKIEIIDSKIATRQLELNDEKDQDKRNKIMHQIKILNVRKEMEEVKEKLKETVYSNRNLKRYIGAIRILPGGLPVWVQCYATSQSAAKKIIQSQYNFKSWFKMMTTKYK